MMAACGCDAWGIDPNKDYIEIARSNATTASFEVRDVGQQGAMDGLADETFDIVFMSDALLFYFIPVNPAQRLDVQVLLGEIRRVLKPDGTFVSMEPHPVFYLAPWLGEPEYPFTCVTEYRSRTFSTTPTFRDFAHAFRDGGFSIADMDELYADEGAIRDGVRGDRFASEFPLWVMFELQKVDRSHE
jgi:SAM-dependent methyltransferase